jgi:hypothetical protein
LALMIRFPASVPVTPELLRTLAHFLYEELIKICAPADITNVTKMSPRYSGSIAQNIQTPPDHFGIHKMHRFIFAKPLK